MADGTKIEWSDATANVINGCSLASPGCTNCYAMKQAHRVPQRQGLTMHTKGGMVWTGEVRFHEPMLRKVLSWKRPRMIFWNAHGDTFHPGVPNDWIDQCFAAMALTPQHIHQVLTKRSDRMREYVSKVEKCSVRMGAILDAMDRLLPRGSSGWQGWPLPNVWLGVSVEDQQRADERIPDLLATPAAVRWISAEPLLAAVDLRKVQRGNGIELDALTGFHSASLMGFVSEPVRDTVARLPILPVPLPGLDWIVAGGESGLRARGSTDEVETWMRSLRDQCAAAFVPFFGKQNFRKQPLPDDLLVRQWPERIAA